MGVNYPKPLSNSYDRTNLSDILDNMVTDINKSVTRQKFYGNNAITVTCTHNLTDYPIVQSYIGNVLTIPKTVTYVNSNVCSVVFTASVTCTIIIV